MKLLLYTVEDDLELENNTMFLNVWIDESKINGFYIPTQDDDIKCINLFFDGEVITVVQNMELVDFLDRKFKVNKI